MFSKRHVAKRFPNQDVAPVPALLPRLGGSSGHLISRRVRRRPGLDTTLPAPTQCACQIALVTIISHCGRVASKRQEFVICWHCSCSSLRLYLSIVWALNVRMRSEADLTAMRTTAGTWFHTLPVLRIIETNLEPIPVGLEHTFRPFALGVRGWRPCGRRHFTAAAHHPLLPSTTARTAPAASVGEPALEPIDPRMLITCLRTSFCQCSLSLAAAVNTPIQGCSGSQPCSSACVRVRLSLGKCSALHLSSAARANCCSECLEVLVLSTDCDDQTLVAPTHTRLPTGYLRHRSAALQTRQQAAHAVKSRGPGTMTAL